MNKPSKNILTLPLRFALVVLIFGALFKVMHWPYSKELMFVGAIAIGVMYTIRFFYKKEKSILDYGKIAIVLLWIFSYLANVFHLFSVPYVFEICFLILFVWWFFKEGMYYFKNRKIKKRGFINTVYYILIGLAAFAIFFGVLFKIQHWPYGSELFVIGILVFNTILILDYFLFEKKV